MLFSCQGGMVASMEPFIMGGEAMRDTFIMGGEAMRDRTQYTRCATHTTHMKQESRFECHHRNVFRK